MKTSTIIIGVFILLFCLLGVYPELLKVGIVPGNDDQFFNMFMAEDTIYRRVYRASTIPPRLICWVVGFEFPRMLIVQFILFLLYWRMMYAFYNACLSLVQYIKNKLKS